MQFDHQKLIRKYWAGDSNLEEESQLRDLIKQDPELDSHLSIMFTYFQEQKENTYSKTLSLNPKPRRMYVRRFLSLAASVLILGMAYVAFSPNFMNDKESVNHLVIDDPDEALDVTMDAFALINKHLSSSETRVRESIGHLDKTLNVVTMVN